MTRTLQRLGYGTLDGVAALAILIFGLAPGSHWHHTLRQILSVKFGLADIIFAFCFMLTWRYCFTLLNLYDKFATVPSRLRAILTGVVIMTIPALVYYKVQHPLLLRSRAVIITVVALFVFEVNRSAFAVHLFDRLAARDPRRALIVGSGRRASKAWRVVRTRYRLSLKLLGFLDDRSIEDMAPDIARRYLGTVDDLETIILREVVDVVLIAMPIRSCYPLMQKAINLAEAAGVQVYYLDDIYSSRVKRQDSSSYLFRELAIDQEHFLAFVIIKRIVDVVGSLSALILLAPILIASTLAIKFVMGGPVLVQFERCGYRRKTFNMLRFRATTSFPASLMTRRIADEVAGSRGSKVLHHRYAATLERWMQATFITELPQLWNVLRGDMSLVGPRPVSADDISLCDNVALTRRFSVRPGITGPWQVSGNKTTRLSEWISVDNTYIDKQSVAVDVSIMARTIALVLRSVRTVG